MNIKKLVIEILLNSFIPFVSSKALDFSPSEIVLTIMGAFLIDTDHLLYMIFGAKLYTPKEWHQFVKVNFNAQIPHFYLFHTVEVLVVVSLLGHFVYAPLLFLSLGFWLNWIVDIFTYLTKYRSLHPWAKYFSLVTFFND